LDRQYVIGCLGTKYCWALSERPWPRRRKKIGAMSISNLNLVKILHNLLKVLILVAYVIKNIRQWFRKEVVVCLYIIHLSLNILKYLLIFPN